jgi:iduronate 2-sulfatase
MADEIVANWAVNRIATHAQQKAGNPDAAPLFMAVGFYNPHTPMVAPQKYFDMFPLETLQLPEILQGDKADTHYKDLFPSTVRGIEMYEKLVASYPTAEEGLLKFVQAYLACTAFVDAQIGAVLDALEANGMADNTIVILTSDHGWNLGEKDHLYKNSPWEESGRVPLVIRAPGVSQPGTQPGAPVSLIDLYPTLVDLCGLTGETRKSDEGRPLDGFSLRPFLENPATRDWDGPDVALTMVHAHGSSKPAGADDHPRYEHYSLRSENFRYVRYNDGSEELYDHRVDPYEWNNIANQPEHAELIETFRKKLESFILSQWAGYSILEDGYVDTGNGFLSWIWVGEEGNGQADWMYPMALSQWAYLPESLVSSGSGAWCYLHETASLAPVDQRDNWFWSQALQTWSYSASEAVTSGPGWVYVMDLSA